MQTLPLSEVMVQFCRDMRIQCSVWMPNLATTAAMPEACMLHLPCWIHMLSHMAHMALRNRMRHVPVLCDSRVYWLQKSDLSRQSDLIQMVKLVLRRSDCLAVQPRLHSGPL